MERKPGITFTPWETDEGRKEKYQTPTVPKATLSRNILPAEKPEIENTDETSQGLKDFGSVDAQIGSIDLFGVPIVCLYVEGKERLCLAQISNTLLRDFSYNEIHNRRVALGITCMQCSPIQLEVLRRSGAMPVSSRRCGLITKREAERLVKSFLEDIPPPKLPENFSFQVQHSCGWGCQGMFMPSRYNSSRAKCIKCMTCNTFFSPNKFIFHYHKTASSTYRHPDAANFNSWRRHLNLVDEFPPESLLFAWEDVKAMFNGGCRKRTSVGKSNFSLSPNRTRESTDYKVPVAPSMIRPYQGIPNNNLYRLDMTENMHSAFSLQPNPTSVASYGEMLRSMSMNYSPWWKSLYMQRHGVPSACNMPPLGSEFHMSNYGHPQIPLPLVDTTESFMDEMNKLSEMSSSQEKLNKEKRNIKSTVSSNILDIPSSSVTAGNDRNIDVEINERNQTEENDDLYNDEQKMETADIFSPDNEKNYVDKGNEIKRPENLNKNLFDSDNEQTSDEDIFDDSDLDSLSVEKLKEFLLKAKQLRKQKDKKRRSQLCSSQSQESKA